MLNKALIEKEFGYMEDHVYLNSSLVGMPPKRVQDACRGFMDEYVPTFNDSIKSDLLVKRKAAAVNIGKLIHADPEHITFEKNVSEANSILAMGYQMEPGCNVVIADCDYPNTIFPWINAQRRGIELKVIKTRNGQISAQQVISAMDENTRVVALSAVQSGWGYFVDLKTIGQECRRRGIVFAVDGFQGLGRVSIDVEDCCIDYLTCGGFKALMGTFGASFVYCSPDIIQDILPYTAAYQSVKSHVLAPGVTTDFGELDFRDDIMRLEAGCQNTYAIHAMSKGVELLLELGTAEVEAHVRALEDILRDKLKNLPLDVVDIDDPQRRSGMVVLQFPKELTETAKGIMKKYKIHLTMREGYMRICLALYNTAEQMDTVYEAMSELCGHIR